MEKENCRMHGQVSRDSFYWMRSHLMDIRGPGGEWRGNKRPQDSTVCGQICGSTCLMQRKRRQNKDIGYRVTKTRWCQKITLFFFEFDDEEYKRIMKNAHRKLESPMSAAMLWRIQLHQHREICGTAGQHKTKYACIVEADESMRIRMEGSQSKNHEDHIAEKGHEIHWVTTLLCTNLFLSLKPWKYQKQRQQKRKMWKIG